MLYGTFTPLNGENNARYKVVAYASDGLLQDMRINVTGGIAADLIVGSLVDASGALVTDPSAIAYVVVESATAGATAFVAANPVHVVISQLGLELNDMDESLVSAQLSTLGFTFADYDTVALRTT